MATKYKMVLIAVDASDEAEEVIEAATTLYPRGTENYRVVTVVPPMMGGISGMDGATFAASWPLRDMEAEISKEITQTVRERVARFGISPEQVSVLYGRPAAEIKAEAVAIGADLIVIGSHSRHGLPRLMLGSTANGVLHGAPCDVLTVHIGEQE